MMKPGDGALIVVMLTLVELFFDLPVPAFVALVVVQALITARLFQQRSAMRRR